METERRKGNCDLGSWSVREVLLPVHFLQPRTKIKAKKKLKKILEFLPFTVATTHDSLLGNGSL